jgi:hypothetical protein
MQPQTFQSVIRMKGYLNNKGHKKEWYYITIPKRLGWKAGSLVKFKLVFANE